MTKKRKTHPARPGPQAAEEKPHQPVDIVDGIPDRCEQRPKWRYVVIAVVFVVWVAFLVYCAAAGQP